MTYGFNGRWLSAIAPQSPLRWWTIGLTATTLVLGQYYLLKFSTVQAHACGYGSWERPNIATQLRAAAPWLEMLFVQTFLLGNRKTLARNTFDGLSVAVLSLFAITSLLFIVGLFVPQADVFHDILCERDDGFVFAFIEIMLPQGLAYLLIFVGVFEVLCRWTALPKQE
jgi:hypothetical protein